MTSSSGGEGFPIQLTTSVSNLSRYRTAKNAAPAAENIFHQQLSGRLRLAVSTVKGHDTDIFVKLQIQRRTEAVARPRSPWRSLRARPWPPAPNLRGLVRGPVIES